MICQFIETCLGRGVAFSLGQAGKLKVNADRAALTPELTEQIKKNKTDIINYLKQKALEQRDSDFQASVLNRHEILTRLGLSESDIDGFYPLIPLQEGMLLQHIMAQDNDPYIANFVLKVQDKTVLEKVLSSFMSVMQRHASCRTSIVWRNVDQAFQLVRKEAKVPIVYIQCANEEQYNEQLTKLQSQQPAMDLEGESLTRIHVLEREDTDELGLFIERHHIVSDHISMEVMITELVMFYNNQQDMLGDAKQHYAYALELLSEAPTKTAYFETLLEGFEAPSLLFDIGESHIESSDTQKYLASITPELQHHIRAQSQRVGVSAASLFHFGWALVMAKYCDSKDILFPTVFTGRMMAPEYRSTIGMFLNSLPFRVKIDSRSVVEQVKGINLQLLQTSQYEQVPLDRAIQHLTDKFGSAFNCIFNYRHSEELDLEDLPFEFVSVKTESTTPFSLSITDTGVGFDASLDAQVGVDGNALLESLALSMQYIVEALSADPVLPFSMPSLLSDQQTSYLLDTLNDTQVTYPRHTCIHSLFEAQAAAHPERIAVVFDGQQLTYRQLNEQANQLAHYLIETHQVTPDTLVGICIERSLEMAVGVMAILKAGGAYVPLDPNYPAERLNYLLEDAGLEVVLSHSSLVETLAAFSGTTVLLDDITTPTSVLCANYSKENIVTHSIGLTSSHLAYVIYTSGSTGKPKGVMVEHGSVVNYQEHVKDAYGFSDSDHILQFSSISFDIFVEEYFGALCQGARLVLRDDACQFGLVEFLAFCDAHQVTIASLPTAFWAQLVADQSVISSHSLRTVIVGGEALSSKTVAQHQHHFGSQVALINSYGPTEGTVTATSHVVSQEDDLSQSITIGKANLNNQLFVLDQNNDLTPLGCIGELHIGGEGVARGYLNQSQLTAERFIRHPFAEQSGRSDKIYKTGDLVRYLNNGNLEFIGRKDDQVKIRGFRVEVGEIEAHLSQLDEVESAVVVIRERASNPNLVGYIKAKEKIAEKNIADYIKKVRDLLGKQLPDYMIPSFIVPVDVWPLTTNGKLDKKALPEPYNQSTVQSFAAAKTDTEKTLVARIADIVELSPTSISINENLLNLGFNSILSLRLSQSLATEFNIEAPLVLILEANNIEELAMELDLVLSMKDATEIEDAVEEEW
ncbi:amino acid adenylation domain-containing protein [Pseudoalteromonas sp. SMS1]|uniref:non-ribosomal peptide synthetase n=1 Tax=Pseudoalteromonas sp. SMS1 TaxID=2908894 RepID=UPI001F27234C|nr:non-ribosomal peptide synthetase [Pseudoalteromonas sp. SMS1]MCF2857585.1 amino acid adenylation domain-containing protein [Pseudoalteromonas sp. SMS1]